MWRAAARLGLAVAAAAVTTSTVAAAPAAPSARQASQSPAAGQVPPSSVPAAAGRSARRVLLVTGDQLLVAATSGGPQLVGAAPGGAGPLATALVTLGAGRDGYEMPRMALPYLGHGLDPALFRVSSLLAGESGRRLPVQVSYRRRAPSLPGITVTHAAGGTARGYLTAAGARMFGAALARLFVADHDRGSYGRDGMFTGGVSVSLAASGARPARSAARAGSMSVAAPTTLRSPTSAKHPLTVTGTNSAGQPDTGDEVIVLSADNLATYEQASQFSHGVAKFSVPAGHYWALAAFYTPAHNGGLPADHLDVLSQFTVSGNTTVHTAARAADSEFTVATPRPAVMRSANILFAHPTPAGNSDSVDFEAAYPVFVSPTTQRPTVGTLQVFPAALLASPPGATGTPYTYNLVFGGSNGLVPPQRHVVKTSSLATVRASYFSDMPGTGGLLPFGWFPAESNDVLVPPIIFGAHMPGREILYMTGNPAILWLDDTFQTFPYLSGGQVGALQSFHAGERAGESWNAYPLHEGYNTDLVGAANQLGTIPSASRAGDMLTLDLTPFSDSIPGHTGNGGFFIGSRGLGNQVTGHYEIDQNGTMIAGGNPLMKAIGMLGEFNTSVTLSPHPSTIRLILDAAGTGPLFPLSSADQTVWAWHSVRESGARLPAGWVCGNEITRSCAVQPMMTLGYAVSGLSLSGSVPGGRQAVHLTVGHLQLATAVPVTQAAMSVSFDGGKTWHPAVSTGSNGRYTAAFTAPSGAKVSLRTRAADAGGGTVTETITNAYQTGP